VGAAFCQVAVIRLNWIVVANAMLAVIVTATAGTSAAAPYRARVSLVMLTLLINAM
jgi:hypothetical protein